ncbi:hypothetical protein RA29_04270 [Tateyamaria sp. ANG-S1]|nr:hypothetical protein RA29_04270 [Tateyamaria sp. ANG-S1]
MQSPGSTTVTLTRRSASAIAAASPAGPPPAIRTSGIRPRPGPAARMSVPQALRRRRLWVPRVGRAL